MTAGAKYELIPPDEHRQNVAEHTIQMWKNHFTNVLAGLHVTFPMHLLWRIHPSQNTTQSPPKLKHNSKNIDMGARQWTPQLHEEATGTNWVPGPGVWKARQPKDMGCDHATDAWNLGTSMKHHCYFLVYSKMARAKHIVVTLYFKHKYHTSPSMTPEESVVKAVQQMQYTLSSISMGEFCKIQE